METSLWQDIKDFFFCLVNYFKTKLVKTFYLFEEGKSWLAARLYAQRGRYSRPFIHSGMAMLVVGGITFGPTLITETFPGLNRNPWQEALPPSAVQISGSSQMETSTFESIKPRAEIIEYAVKEGDTVSTIAEKFGISLDTIRWENKLASVKAIKPGQALRILPTTGVMHKVKPGETIHSIAKRYDVDPQEIADWPFNTYTNDETFELSVGQTLMVPNGVMPQEVPISPKKYYAVIPGAGLGTGQFVWPAGGRITQGYSWYHKGIDIASSGLSNVLASDAGTVVVAGWSSPWAYGNRVIVDHGNGFSTLYAHLSSIAVSPGDRVGKGQVIGRVGSTGRSTGPHLHLEIRQNGVAQNPLGYLR